MRRLVEIETRTRSRIEQLGNIVGAKWMVLHALELPAKRQLLLGFQNHRPSALNDTRLSLMLMLAIAEHGPFIPPLHNLLHPLEGFGYQFWSGIGSDAGEITLVGIALAW